MEPEDILALSEKQIEKIERVNGAIERRELAYAQKESQKKLRILFERAAEETLPFIIYVLYMGSMAVVVVFRLLDFDGEKLWIGGFLLLTVMIAPLFVLPSTAFSGLLNWFKRLFGNND